MYAEPPKDFEALVAPFSDKVGAIAAWLRHLILAEFPQCDEIVYGGVKVANALYSVGGPNRVALGIQPGPRVVKLFLHDPEHLGRTEFKLEGKGKHMRHIKFAAIPEERRAELIALMRIPVEGRS